ncbi:hypothetical protein AMATHDRAFT_139821 [Amanita thiersii Skay4041]|uniref:Peptidase S8/S53 domain-containing protein n=1 Tax=Amanita thiersii Skay4041 TaxID=703135 RepID=A0A2A9NXN6_9AGAR|nr:hypothetical protein AMATHDRAFT_139821 [Amanita thiersii Skay4041]
MRSLIQALVFITLLVLPSWAVKLKSSSSSRGRYIVLLNKDAAPDYFSKMTSKITHSWSTVNGFAGYFDQEELDQLASSPLVKHIERDGIAYAQSLSPRTDAPWGLARINTRGRLMNPDPSALNYTYVYDSSAGAGTDIYVVAKLKFCYRGVFLEHKEFSGRARWGATFGGYTNADGNGHGTHIAGSAAGTRFGVAKGADIIAVKVLSDQGSGSVTDIVSGIDFVISSHHASGRPSVILLAIGGGPSVALDDAVITAINAGIPVSVSAGASASDVSNFSPQRVQAAFVIGASTTSDSVASFSNIGSGIDMFAPGQSIVSAWIGSTSVSTLV